MTDQERAEDFAKRAAAWMRSHYGYSDAEIVSAIARAVQTRAPRAAPKRKLQERVGA